MTPGDETTRPEAAARTSSGGERRVGDDSGPVVHDPLPEKAVIGLRRPSRVPRGTRKVVLVAALAVSSCGGSSAGDARVLSEAEYLAVVKRGCVAARQVAERAVRTSAIQVVYLRRAAQAAESIQREFAKVRPPTRFAAAHHDSLRLGEKQLALIRTALARLQGGAAPEAVAGLEARNRRLLQRSNEIADELGLPECVSELAGP